MRRLLVSAILLGGDVSVGGDERFAGDSRLPLGLADRLRRRLLELESDAAA